MDLIARYQNAGFEAVADGVMAFFDRRTDPVSYTHLTLPTIYSV